MLAHSEPATRPEVIVCGLDTNDDFDCDVLTTRDYGTRGAPCFVLLANAPTAELLRAAADAGVQAVLSKDISCEVLHRVLELVMLGQRLFPAPAAGAFEDDEPEQSPAPRTLRPPPGRQRPHLRLAVTDTEPDVQLSEREAQILRCLGDGAPNKRIARDLAITEATVKVHIKGLLRKLRVNNRTQAAVWGLNNAYATESRPIATIALAERLPALRLAP